MFTYAIASYRIAGGVASSNTGRTDRSRSTRSQAQEVLEEEEPGEELSECVDHQPSSFERGKPRSILSLLLYKINSLYMSYRKNLAMKRMISWN
jgi:hypothetical protein